LTAEGYYEKAAKLCLLNPKSIEPRFVKSRVYYSVVCLCRAQAVNPQIGREEYSAFIRLIVTGDVPAETAPEIVVKPADMHIIKGEAAVDLHCIANARYAPE
jgi:hypothetical protein